MPARPRRFVARDRRRSNRASGHVKEPLRGYAHTTSTRTGAGSAGRLPPLLGDQERKFSSFLRVFARGAIASGAIVVARALTVGSVEADNLTWRIAAGHPAAPVSTVNQLRKAFLPNVTRRVAAEAELEVSFFEGHGGTVANLSEILESTQKGLVNIGAMCSCFEPTKRLAHNINCFVPFISADPKVMDPAMRQLNDEYDYFHTVFDRYEQTHLPSGAFDDHGLGTALEWSKVEDMKGAKIGAAGPNRPWLDHAGASKVPTKLNEA